MTSDMSSESGSRTLRLVRQPGIRRKSHSPASQSLTKDHDFCQFALPASDGGVAFTPSVCEESALPSTSSPPVAPTNGKTLDAVLAQLMGVPSLTEAGLSREQCLALLRASGDTRDADDAELDILFAVSTATNVDAADGPDTETPKPPESLYPTDQLSFPVPEPITMVVQPGDNVSNTSILQQGSELERPTVEIHGTSSVKHVSHSDANRGMLYRLQPIGGVPWFLDVRLDRRWLDALFDRNQSIFETVLCILLSFYVGAVGYCLLQSDSFRDFNLFLCCFAIAGCHFSLVKSVQPDSASAQHGFNRVIVFSRSLLFCFLATLFLVTASSTGAQFRPAPSVHYERVSNVRIGQLSLIDRSKLFVSNRPLLLPSLLDFPLRIPVDVSSAPSFIHSNVISSDLSLSEPVGNSTLFGVYFSLDRMKAVVHFCSFCLLLIFPFLFLFGLVPQADTAVLYGLEQLDIHVFGASGSVSLSSAAFSIFRNLVVISSSYWLCFNAVRTGDPFNLHFSIFWSVYVPLCYILSRLPSNLHLYTLLIPTATRRTQIRTAVLSRLAELRDVVLRYCGETSSKRTRAVRCWVKKSKPKPPASTEQRESWWRDLFPFVADPNRKSVVPSRSMVQSPSTRCLHSKSQDSTRDGRRFSSGSGALQMPLFSDRKYASSPILRGELSDTEPVQLVSSSDNFPDVQRLPHHASCSAFIAADTCSPPLPSTVETEDRQLVDPLSVQIPPADAIDADAPTATTPLLHPSNRASATLSSHTESEISGEVEWVGKPSSSSDPLPGLLHAALLARLENDVICVLLVAPLVFGLHFSPLLRVACTNGALRQCLLWTVILSGAFLHYIWPNLRSPYPWLLLARPVIPTDANGELTDLESGYFWLCWIGRNFLLPTLTVVNVTLGMNQMLRKFGPHWTSILTLFGAMKMLRNGYAPSSAGRPFIVLFFVELFFSYDFPQGSEAYPLNYLVVSIFLTKLIELVHKLHFVYIYTSPFRIVWGSLTHCIGQIASIPHAILMLANCVLSTLLSSPLEPFLASAIFLTSHPRPIKFWEVEHRTERMETTNTVLASQLRATSRSRMLSNLNSIFYEHLTRSLQSSLAGDIYLGRLGGLSVNQGDVFILGSDDLHFLVHIIEMNNGIVSFQLRGLEFIGTCCHEQETEVLRLSSHNDFGFCCCYPGHCPGMLSLNAAFRMRCMTWQFVDQTYRVDGYSMASPSADMVVRMHDLRRILINRFIQCIIYFLIRLPDLHTRLDALTPELRANGFFSEHHVELDPVFLAAVDPDFDAQANGVTRRMFVQVYLEWIRFCLGKNSDLVQSIQCDPDSPLVVLCYALSLLGRRCVGGNQSENYDVNQVLRGIHDVFKGDIQVTNKDDWVLSDLDLLQSVITPAMRIGLKLYQDIFLWVSRMSLESLYRKIIHTENNYVICHEADPAWRLAVLNNAHRLFSIRWVGGQSEDTYHFIQLTKTKLQLYAVKINEECVRGLWSGQQREQIYIRSTDPERGSIQGAQHVLRNLVNSSCDPPIGYPIYVSPILTSFVGSHKQLAQIGGGEFSFRGILRGLVAFFSYVCSRCSAKRDIATKTEHIELLPRHAATQRYSRASVCGDDRQPASVPLLPRQSSTTDSAELRRSRPRNLANLTTLSALVHHYNGSSGELPPPVKINRSTFSLVVEVKIVDHWQLVDDHVRRLHWPVEEWRLHCLPRDVALASIQPGMVAERVHRWTPNHPDVCSRSFCARTIALLRFSEGPSTLKGNFVAIWEERGICEISAVPSISAQESQNPDAPLPFASCSLNSLS